MFLSSSYQKLQLVKQAVFNQRGFLIIIIVNAKNELWKITSLEWKYKKKIYPEISSLPFF